METKVNTSKTEVSIKDATEQEVQQVLSDPQAFALAQGLDPETKGITIIVRYPPRPQSSDAKLKWKIEIKIKIGNE